MASKKERNKVTMLVQDAIRTGELVKPDSCQLCGAHKTSRKIKGEFWRPWKSCIVAHHWRGYDHPLDVWFICQSCNVILGKRTGLSMIEAKRYVSNRRTRTKMLAQYKKELRRQNGISRHPKGLSFEEWMAARGKRDCVHLWPEGVHPNTSKLLDNGQG